MFRVEREEQPATTNPATILGFGKYRSLCVESVFEVDPNYCRWLSYQKSMSLNPAITEFLNDKFKATDDGTYVINWGRHKGKSIKLIKQIDEKYLDWLRGSKFVKDKQAWLIEKIDQL